MQDYPCADEERTLDEAVASYIDEGTGQRPGGEECESHQNDSCVAHRGKRQHPFQVPLDESHAGADDGGGEAHGEQKVAQERAVNGAMENGPVNPRHRVQSELHHDSGKKHRGGGGGDGMGVGKPEVKGTIDPLTRKPMLSRSKAASTCGSLPPPASRVPTQAMLSPPSLRRRCRCPTGPEKRRCCS